MNSDTTTASMSFVVDEDDMASDLATKVPTQQSVKAYGISQPVYYAHRKTYVYNYPTNAAWYSGASGSGALGYAPYRLFAYTGATTNSAITGFTIPHGLSTTAEYLNWNTSFKFTCWFYCKHTDPANQFSTIKFLQANTFGTADLTVRGIGIKIAYVDGSNTHRLYIVSHDGTTYSTTDTSFNLTWGQVYQLEFIFTGATSLQVLIDGDSKGTKTTNIPTGTGNESRWGIGHKRDGGSAVDQYDGIAIHYPTLNGWC